MKTFSFVGFALSALFPAMTVQAGSAAPVPAFLRCEYADNPLGVDVAQPRLGWVLPSNERGVSQAAYQIVAASSLEVLAQDKGDLWDTGKVASGALNQITYAGKALVSSQRVFWKVRIQDGAGRASAWSVPAQWVMGVLKDADWLGAKWIGAPDNNLPFDAAAAVKGPKEKYESVLLRRGIPVKPGLRRALLHVCGLSQYEMTLNGAKVGDTALAPGWTAYDKTCLYDSYEVTAALRQGANVLGLFLGNGFYNNHDGRYAKTHGTFGPLQAIALLRLEYADGTVENVVTDETWKTSSGPIVFSSIYAGEDFDARLVQKGWDQPGFDDARWERPGVTKGPGGALRGLSASAPPVRVMQTLVPIGKKAISPNVTVYDLGQNAALMAFIKVRGAAGGTVKVSPSELVSDNGDINDRMTHNQSYGTYTLGGLGEESCQWKFYYRGGRYLRVETTAAPGGGLPEVIAIEGRVIRADAPVAGQFSTSSDLVNKIHRLVRWAQMSNMMSVMTDCPHREKLGWLEEDHLNGPALRYNFGVSTLFGKMVNDMADGQRANGLVPSLVPNYYHWDEGKFTTPIQWGSACIFVPWQQYEFEGDTQILKDHYEVMKRYLDYLARRANDNIVSFGLGDWYDNLSEGEPTLTPVGLTDTAFYCLDYQVMAKIAGVLGKKEDAAQFENKAAEIKKAFNKQYYNAATGSYAAGSQGANCLPLAMDLAEPAWRPALLRNLVDDLQARNTTAGEVSFRYLLLALADAGLNDLIYSTYTSETNGYGLQVKLGKTTLTEAWNGGNSSQNHFMYGQINEWFYHDLAGIQCDPAAPGFKKIVIKPSLVGDLTWVKASYRCPYGDIVSQWANGPAGVTLEVTIPVGSSATIFVPAADAALVRESGLPAASAPGLTFLRQEKGAAVYSAVCGSYVFSSGIAATAPARLTATAQAGRVALAWPASVNGARYTVKRSTTSGSGYIPLAANLSGTTYTDAAVTNDTAYYYAVTATNSLGESRAVEAAATPATIVNAGFETPVVHEYLANPPGAGWTFSPAAGANGSGITQNGSGYTGDNPGKIPEGRQAAFLQGTGTITQTLGGLIPGTAYVLTFSAAERVSSNQGGQTWQVKLDGRVIGDYSPGQAATAYTDYTAKFAATARTHVLSFIGTNKQGGDNTVFIDNVRLVKTAF